MGWLAGIGMMTEEREGNGEGDKQWVSDGEELVINDWNVLKDRKSPKKIEMWRETRQIKTDDYRKRQGHIHKGAS